MLKYIVYLIIFATALAAINNTSGPDNVSDTNDYPIEYYSWVPDSDGHVPPDAVRGGIDRDGTPLYIGRAYFGHDLLPGKISPQQGLLYVSYGGREERIVHYEVLCSRCPCCVSWVLAKNGCHPREALPGGNTSSGEILYIGRASIDGSISPGKIQPSSSCLYVPYYGTEHKFYTYEILLFKVHND